MIGGQDLSGQAVMGRVMPQWMRSYRREQFLGDITAGVMVTIIIVPQGLAFALLLGVPPVMGLYASLTPLVVFAIFAKGRFVSPGPTPAAALATLGAVLPVASPGEPDFIAAVLAVGVSAGLFLMLFSAVGLGGLLRYVSQPVLSGFTTGLAVLVAVNQLPSLLGVQVERTFFAPELVLALARKSAEVNATTVVIALIAVLLLSNRVRLANGVARLFRSSPVVAKWSAQVSPLMAIVAGVIVVWVGDLSRKSGVKTVGEIPQGVPEWGLPFVAPDMLEGVFVAGFTVALVIMIETWSVGTRLAEKRGENTSSTNNLFAMGAANLASGITSGYPVSGGLARSAVNLDAGAATPLSAALTAVCVLVIVVAAPHLLSAVPHAILAATIFAAGISQLGFSDFRKAWEWNRAEGVGYLAALVGVLWLGLVCGLLIGFGASIALVILRLICLKILTVAIDAELGADPLNRRLRLMVYGDVNFLSAPHLEGEIFKAINGDSRLREVEIFSTDWRAIDFTAHTRLETLAAKLQKNGVRLSYVAGSHTSHRNKP
ncbi:MAG: SulP family inorganic anion transporter [Hyphomicrobiales bacterium]|nr:SulP family inorganic anion transporter [Hyphomicrobiales bacterium]